MKRLILAAIAWCIAASATTGSTILLAADPFLLTTPVAFTTNWTKTWGGSAGESVHNMTADAAGNTYVVGEFGGTVDFDPGSGVATYTSSGGQDSFLSKFDPSGTFIWARTWGGSGRDVPNGLGVDGLGNVYVTGPFQYSVDFNPDPGVTDTHTSNSATGGNNIFLSQFDANGNFRWARTWGPAEVGGESYSLTVDSSNYVYVEGDFSGTTTDFNPDPLKTDLHTNHPGPSAAFDSFLSKFDSNGNLVWAKTWGGEGYDDGPSVAVDGLGNVYVGGMYASTTINFDPAGGSGGAHYPAHDSGYVVDVFLSKFDSNGNFQWVRTWGGQGTEEAGESVIVDGANNVYISGRFACASCDFDPGASTDIHSSNGDRDAFVSKFDGDGNFLWARTWGGPGWDAADSIAVDGANNLYATGKFNGTVAFDPGGTTTRTSNGKQDVFLSQFAPTGTFQWVNTWGGSGDDSGYRISIVGLGSAYVGGLFSTTVDFDPGAGVDNHTSNGSSDAFLTAFSTSYLSHAVYIPLIAR